MPKVTIVKSLYFEKNRSYFNRVNIINGLHDNANNRNEQQVRQKICIALQAETDAASKEVQDLSILLQQAISAIYSLTIARCLMCCKWVEFLIKIQTIVFTVATIFYRCQINVRL